MTADPNHGGVAQGSRTLTFRGGGWVILLAAVLVLLVIGWSTLGVLLGHRPVGDGRTLASYRYDLSTTLIPQSSLTPSGYPRGFLPSLDDPQHLRGAEMLVYNEQNRPKYVVTTDRVLGIVINGQAHAWPLSMMNAHEIVNDTVAGTPVVATYSPLCDAAAVFNRRVGGVVRRFEVSGLLVNSNLVFCDKSVEGGAKPAEAPDHVPSLFLQLERRAVAGPLAKSGTELELLPDACITTWSDWLALHPDTTVTLRDPQMIRRMKEISYARYYLSPTLEYPCSPVPDEAALAAQGLRLKSPMLLIEVGSDWFELPVESAAAKAGEAGSLEVTIAGTKVEVQVPTGPAVARARRMDGQPLRTVPCLKFSADAVFAGRTPAKLLVP